MDLKKKLIFSGVLGVLAFIGILSYVRNKEQHLLQLSEMTYVLAAAKDILANTQIDETMVGRIQVPRKFVQPMALTSLRDAIGRVAFAPIHEGEQILGTKLIQLGSQTGLAMKIPVGFRAVSIAVNEVTGVAHLIRADDFIDVLGSFDFGDQAQAKKYTYTLFENIQVLAVEQNMGEGFTTGLPKEEKGEGVLSRLIAEQKAGGQGMTLTLAMSPEDAQRLVLSQETGSISVALRPRFGSDNILKLEPVTPYDLTGLKSLIRQSKQPTYMEYRGGR
ncbi:MAG: Flp pilus assembly protein CpaB [Deltaproteobacteria bacterium]|nr:Flp pilus assembly protein CpaB [Deltaproteobacteria bacterium]MBI4224187.1 Flp pilus assembly protein CpaB [Deltaproteobacteria bacterium]